MRTAAVFLLALGVSFGALLLGGLSTTPALAQDVGAFDDDESWFGADDGWVEDPDDDDALGESGLDDDQPYGGVYGDGTAGLYEDEWWEWGPDDQDLGEAALEDGLHDGGLELWTDDGGFDAWYGEFDGAFHSR